MKKILLASLTLLCASCAHTKQVSTNPAPVEPAQTEPVPAKAEVTTPLPIEPFSSEPLPPSLPSELLPGDSILAFVRSKLPNDPLTLTGTLKVRTKKGFTKISLPVQMELNWGASTPSASYHIGNESLKITWQNDLPDYTFSNNRDTPTSNILGTGLTWADLSFSVLWWPNSKLIDEEKKINRECYVVDVPVPASENTMRLWIEKKMGMLLEAQTLDAEKKEIRRMKIKSIKKMDGMWVAKDLEIRDKATGNKTTLQITDLQWENPKPTRAAFDPANSVNQLSIDLYKKLSAENDGNLFLSPYSISAALAMTYGGARGETAGQMDTTLHFGGQGATHPALSHLRKKLNGIQEKGHVQLSVANSLWPQKDYTFLPDYLALTKEFYGSEIVPVDYKADAEGARQQINVWVEDQTNDRIKDLIPEGMLDPLTRLVLANAIYFKGDWASQFKPERTRPAPFKLAEGKTVEVPMMSQTADFRLAHTKEFQALELPYEGGDLSMLILLPNASNKLPDLNLEMIDGLEFNEMEVMVQLPKFKLESTFRLGDTLAAMGMPLAFSDKADFSGMTGTQDLFIGAVIHKA
ncbi:MAG: outer membrane lipoprotein-sorting protein, partial [Verrucomicrobia bacterium]|nr:outer membrane lipoprotein-sorting protein [Verrucomicrobiota bacterium]